MTTIKIPSDYYERLGLKRYDKLTDTQVTDAYRGLSRRYYPGGGGTEPNREWFEAITEARDGLQTADKRKLYSATYAPSFGTSRPGAYSRRSTVPHPYTRESWLHSSWRLQVDPVRKWILGVGLGVPLVIVIAVVISTWPALLTIIHVIEMVFYVTWRIVDGIEHLIVDIANAFKSHPVTSGH